MADDPARVVEASYDELGDRYRMWAASFEDRTRLDWVDDFAGRVPSGAVVLDLGCGPGTPTGARLRGRGYEIVGLDRSCAQLALAQKHLGSGRVVRGDLRSLPFAAASADGAVALYSLTHLPADEQTDAIREAARVLRRGGWLLATFSAGVSHDWHGEWLGTSTFFGGNDPETNRRLVVDAGFTIERDEDAVLAEPEGEARFHWVLAQSW
jgi:ubiquinone/menaquinone biosynthesis C-methylase UbiE